MSRWIKGADGAYHNTHTATSAYTFEESGDWVIELDTGGPTGVRLNGTWSVEADAREVLERLVDGIDPADFNN